MNKTIFKGFTFLIMSLFLLTACATGSPSDGNEGTKKEEKASGDTASKDNVTIAFQENVQTLDPHNSSSGIDISVLLTMYESLFIPNEEGELDPLLAEGYEVSEDGLKYTFQLKEGVKFTDGAKFNAETVKINLERIIDSEGS